MKEIDLSALDDLEGGLLLSPVGARSVAQDSFETNECRRKEGRRERLRIRGGASTSSTTFPFTHTTGEIWPLIEGVKEPQSTSEYGGCS
jgi:hypothetical protein